MRIDIDRYEDKAAFIRTIDTRTLILDLSNSEWLAKHRPATTPEREEQNRQWLTAIREELADRFGDDRPDQSTAQAFQQAAADRGTYPERIQV